MNSSDFSFPRPSGMRGFVVIWLGQFISGVASSIMTVALPIWIFSITGSGTAVGLLEFFFFSSYLAFALFAGVLIDRYPRKMTMLVYDFLSLSAMAVLLVLQSAGRLEVWHLYLAAIFQGVGYAFQAPSYSAAITTMVPKKQYIRANGLMSLLNDGPDIFGPLIAGGLYLIVGLDGIIALNLLAFVVSIGALLFVDVPSKQRTITAEIDQKRLFKQMIFGLRYILRRPGLLGLQLIFFMGNLFSGIALSTAALYPMILLRTGNDTQVIGIIQSVGALTAVLGGVLITTWGGIKRPVHAILMAWFISSLFGLTFLGAGQMFVMWLIGMALNSIFEPVVNVSMDTFLQTKIPPSVQGRVFSASDFFSQALIPFTPLLAGLFGDRIFEPAMKAGGPLANIFGGIVGTGPGSGFGLLILICGVGGTLIGLSGFIVREIRELDSHMPDYRPTQPLGTVGRMDPALALNPASYDPAVAPAKNPLEENVDESPKPHPEP